MAEFQKVMHEWKRMCKVYTREDEDDCCKGCPMGNMGEHGCDAIFSDFPEYGSWDDVEKIIDKWAAEHPEPVYPTWHDFLYEQGVLTNKMMCGMREMTDVATSKVNDPIPADIARKLGIEPKEG